MDAPGEHARCQKPKNEWETMTEQNVYGFLSSQHPERLLQTINNFVRTSSIEMGSLLPHSFFSPESSQFEGVLNLNLYLQLAFRHPECCLRLLVQLQRQSDQQIANRLRWEA